MRGDNFADRVFFWAFMVASRALSGAVVISGVSWGLVPGVRQRARRARSSAPSVVRVDGTEGSGLDATDDADLVTLPAGR
jgi:hypothetical protein